MELLQNYLENEYLIEKEQYDSIQENIRRVLPLYLEFNKEKGWSYEAGKEIEKISASTTSMVAFSLAVVSGKKSDLVTGNEGENYLEVLDKNDSNKYTMILGEALKILSDNFQQNEKSFESSTYGKNDPFTFTWVKYLVDHLGQDDTSEFKDDFEKCCISKIDKILKTFYSDNEILNFSDNDSKIVKVHRFPLLKITQLYYAFRESFKNEGKYINSIKESFKNSLHCHLSLAAIDNSDFDAAELVFSLEGLLILDENRKNFDKNLIDRVFQVLKERQKLSLYWRPLKPFVTNKQGLALLPLSVEIAMSLIRICNLLGEKGVKVFSDNFEIFNKYTEWLKMRVSILQARDKSPLYGWCSEHIDQYNVIHTWETSQVIVYLVNFNYMLQKHITYRLRSFANFSCKTLGHDREAWNNWTKGEPVTIDGFAIYDDINKHFLSECNCYSMLLYGPPGTGKTAIAEKIACTKGWPLITITPSDFIANGTDKVEIKAKNIFTVLTELRDVVVLFDEIDRLILDRESGFYFEQSDMFQFMTPSMLVKLKDLREKKKIIFIICTNYEERIDHAIKRTGRIDKKYLVLPLDKNCRKAIIEENLTELEPSKIEELANKTALCTYADLKEVISMHSQGISAEHFQPTITLLNYSKRLGVSEDEKNHQKPRHEFLALLLLKNEVDKNFLPEEKELMRKFFKSERELNPEWLSRELKNESAQESIKELIDLLI